MSTRAAANIRDEMEALGPVRLTEVQEAQKQIIMLRESYLMMAQLCWLVEVARKWYNDQLRGHFSGRARTRVF